MITLDQFTKLFPKAVRMPDTYQALVDEMIVGKIDNNLRQSYFLAQLAHESAGFHYIKELGGPSYFKKMYDISGNRPSVARRLGNIHAGDGARFPGRGWIQLTGRHNYTLYSQLLGLDLVGNPELAGNPEVAAKVACKYWVDHACNALSDSSDFVAVTKKINGGTNGLPDRRRWLAKIQHIIGT